MARAKPAKPERSGRGSRRTRWEKRLMFAEAVLVMRLIEEVAEDRIVTLTVVPGWARVLLVMLLFVGAFGSLFVLLHRSIEARLVRAHDAVQQLPVPTPRFAVHGLVLALLFVAYAWWYGPETDTLPALWRFVQQWGQPG